MPATDAMHDMLRDYIFHLNLMSPRCFDALVVQQDLADADCLKATASKAIGLVLVAMSVMVKVPQILKMLSARSGQGISFAGNCIELLAYAIYLAYSLASGFPFSSYGDAVFVTLQTVLIALLVLFFNGNRLGAAAFAAFCALVAFAIQQPGLIPMELLWWGQVANLPISSAGKMVQVIAVFRAGHTGQLSAVTIFQLFLGCVLRVFTSVQETGDAVIILGYVIAGLIYFVMSAQIVYYWDATNKVLEKEKGKKKE